MSLFTMLLAATLLVTTALAFDDLNIQLKLATTTHERFDILSPSSPLWRFDFHAQPGYTFSPGSVVNANAKSFPALEGVGMTLAQLNLGPCAMLPPHLHPRADNVVVAVTGNTTTWMVNENGVGTVVTELTPGMMTVFPRGSVHTMQNNGCDDAQLISALNSQDTGTLNIMNVAFNQLPAEMMKAALGDASLHIDDLKKDIPEVGTGSVLGSYECRARCGL